MDKETVKTYTNGELTIIWKPSVCIHSTLCWKGAAGLKDVFNPAERPWIKPQGATTERIIEQIKKCPSGALSFQLNNDAGTHERMNDVKVMENGPLLVHGTLMVTHCDGRTEERNDVTAFCRCGHSANKPFCDGSHVKSSFKG